MEIFCLAGILAAGCSGPVEMGGGNEESTGFQRIDPGEGPVPEAEAPEPKTLYVTGVEYPADYDWRADLGSNAEGSTLFLMKDSVRIVEVTVGYDSCVSADADMHRCIDGHLYTDFSTESETVIKMDGKELFRYAGREMIEGMCVKDGIVYTIGVPRSGSGWTYRGNGEILLSGSEGSLVGGLYEDGSSVVFSYSEPADTLGITGRQTYYIVADGVASAVSRCPLCVDDIRRIDGTVYCVGSATSSGNRAIYYDNQSVALDMPGSYSMYGDSRILYDGGDILVYGSVGNGAALWRWSDLVRFVSPGSILGICVSDSDCYYVGNTSTGGEATGLYTNNTRKEFPEGYDFVYSGCIGADLGICCVGMSKPAESYRPALWIDGEIADYDFNGVFTGVYYQ